MRVTRTPDMARLGEALSRPGMDPRSWVKIGVVEAFHAGEDGVFADVRILPDDYVETCRVGSVYAGPGFGLYADLDAGDEVVVAFPSGDADEGPVVISRTWSASDPPPLEDRGEGPALLLRVKDGARLRIVAVGASVEVLSKADANKAGGNVSVTADGNATVSAKGDAIVSAEKGAAVSAQGNAVVEAGQDARVTASGSVAVQAGTEAVVTAAKAVVDAPDVTLGGAAAAPLDGVVTGLAIDTFTGMTMFALGGASSKVKAVK